MIAVPDYLEPYARNENRGGEYLSFDIRCSCGCESFHLRKNYLTAQELKIKEEYMRSRPRFRRVHGELGEDGKIHHYVRRFFFFRQEVEIPEAPAFDGVQVVKAVCESCGREIVLFDSRANGLDAELASEAARDYVPHFREDRPQYSGVLGWLEQDADRTMDPNLFTWIRICRKKAGKKRYFFEAHTG